MYTDRQIWKVSYPIMLSLLAQNIINITDTAFVGHVGEIELGGAALGGLWYLTIFMAGFGFSTGAQILMGRRNGEGRLFEIAPVFIQGTAFLLALAGLIIIMTDFYVPSLMRLWIKSDAVFQATLDYLDWRIVGLLFSFSNVMFRAFYVGITNTRVLSTSAIVMAVVNIVLDYALIFGKFGLPAWGLKGAALASVIAEASSVIYFIWYTWSRVDVRSYGFRERSSYNMRLLPHILGVSIWTMIQYFFALGTWFVFFVATEHLGERSLAISNIVRSVSSMLFMPVSAYGTAANTLVSNLMGEGRVNEVPRQLWLILRQSVMVVLPLMVITVVFAHPILRVFTEQSSLVSMAIPSLLVLVSSYLLTTPGSVLFQFVSGTGNTRSALAMELFTLTFYMIFVILVAFKWQLPVQYCWFSEHVYWGIILIVSLLYMRFADWRSKQI